MSDSVTLSDAEATLEFLVKKERVIDYLHRFARLCDNFEVDRAINEFTDDGSYRLIPRENYDRGLPVCIIDDNKDRLLYRKTLILDHWHHEQYRETRQISNFVISFPEPDVALSESTFVIYRTSNEGETAFHIAGVFRDTLVHRERRWRIKDRFAILETFNPVGPIILMP